MGTQYSYDLDAMRSPAGALLLQPDEPSDEYLLHALASGGVWAMELLYHRYSRLFYTLAYRMVGDHQVTEEVVQDAFLAIWQHATSYSPQAGLVRWWLISLVRHRAVDYLRRKHSRSNWKEISWETAETEKEATSPDVWEDAWCSLQRAQVREALLHLRTEQRLVITLAFFCGWTHSEIAQRCQLPIGTVKSRVRLGLLHLKQVLEQRGVVEQTSSGSKN